MSNVARSNVRRPNVPRSNGGSQLSWTPSNIHFVYSEWKFSYLCRPIKEVVELKFSFRCKFKEQTSRPRRGQGSKKTASRCLETSQLPRGLHHCLNYESFRVISQQHRTLYALHNRTRRRTERTDTETGGVGTGIWGQKSPAASSGTASMGVWGRSLRSIYTICS